MKYQTVISKKVKGGIKLRCMGDTHYGETAYDGEYFDRACKDARDKERKIIWMGDMVTSIPPGDRRWNIEEHQISLADQQHWLRVLLENYGDITEHLHVGNHELTHIRNSGNWVLNLCDELNVDYAGFQRNTLYKHKSKEFTLYTTHGTWALGGRAGEGRRKKTNKEIRIKDFMRTICYANLSIMGHAHQGILSTPHYSRQLVNTGLPEYEEFYLPDDDGRVYACCPSFLRIYQNGYENYATGRYEPTGVGWVDVDINENMELEDVQVWESYEGEFIMVDSLKKRMVV